MVLTPQQLDAMMPDASQLYSDELLSTSTAHTDRTLKKNLYQNRFHTPEYFWFSPDTLEFAGFTLKNLSISFIISK